MFQILTTPEPLLKLGYYVGMIGEWGDKYPSKWYQVVFPRYTIRDFYSGIMPSDAAAALEIDPASTTGMGMEPRYYTTIYQVRMGLSPDWGFYLRWPSGEYRMPLEQPGFEPVPTEYTSTEKGLLGFIDSRQSPITPDAADLKWEMFYVRDWMPVFYAYPHFVTSATSKYVKLITRQVVNMITMQPVRDPETRKRLENLQLPFKPVFHYSEYMKRSAGIV